jgi:hypothetical protein
VLLRSLDGQTSKCPNEFTFEDTYLLSLPHHGNVISGVTLMVTDSQLNSTA